MIAHENQERTNGCLKRIAAEKQRMWQVRMNGKIKQDKF